MQKKLTIEQEEQLINLFNAGLSHKDLGLRFNMSKAGVGTLLYRKGVRREKKQKEKKILQIKRIPQELKNAIIQEYKNGGILQDICAKYGIREGTMRGWFWKKNISLRGDKRGQAKVLQIIELHRRGKNNSQIASETGFTLSSVTQILGRRKIKPNKYKYTPRRKINEYYFKFIDTHKKAYFFGLLCSDGSVQLKQRRVTISLKEEDGYLIKALQKELETDTPIGIYSRKLSKNKAVAIQIHSEILMNDVIRHGCGPQKSLTLKFPKLKKEFFWSFMRGFFDGDGHISASGLRFSITTSTEFNYELQRILKNEFDIKCCISLADNYSELIVYRKKDLYKIRGFLYENAEIYMKRKHERFFKGNYLYIKSKKAA